MSRREIREQVFKLLFRVEFNNQEEMIEQKDLFFNDNYCFSDEEDKAMRQEDKDVIQDKYDKIMEHLEKIDAKINEKASGWNTKRMAKVDLTLIRVAVYEILFDEDVPEGVAINEAVELAKKYGQDESYAFVNGVLAKFIQK